MICGLTPAPSHGLGEAVQPEKLGSIVAVRFFGQFYSSLPMIATYYLKPEPIIQPNELTPLSQDCVCQI